MPAKCTDSHGFTKEKRARLRAKKGKPTTSDIIQPSSPSPSSAGTRSPSPPSPSTIKTRRLSSGVQFGASSVVQFEGFRPWAPLNRNAVVSSLTNPNSASTVHRILPGFMRAPSPVPAGTCLATSSTMTVADTAEEAKEQREGEDGQLMKRKRRNRSHEFWSKRKAEAKLEG